MTNHRERQGQSSSPTMRTSSKDEASHRFRPLSPSIITGAEFDQLSLGPHLSKNASCNNSVAGSASINELDLSNEDIDDLVGTSLSVFSQTPSTTLLPPLGSRSQEVVPSTSFIFSKSQEHSPKVTGYRAISPKQYVIDEHTVVKDRKARGNSSNTRHNVDQHRPLSPMEFFDFGTLSNQPSMSKVSLSLADEGPSLEQYEPTAGSSFKSFRGKSLLRNSSRPVMHHHHLAPLVTRSAPELKPQLTNNGSTEEMTYAIKNHALADPSSSTLDKFDDADMDHHPSVEIDLGSHLLNASQVIDGEFTNSQVESNIYHSTNTHSIVPQTVKPEKLESPPNVSYAFENSNDENHSISSSITDLKHIYTYSLADKDESTLPYQVHRRILGWKITSVQRRKDLVDMLDIMNNPEDPHLKLRMGTLSPTVKNGMPRFAEIHTQPPREELARIRKVSYRQSDSLEKFLSRSLKMRQSYTSVNAIRGLMEEKRKALRTRDAAIRAGVPLPTLSERLNTSQNIHQNSLTSNDQNGIKVDEDTFLKMVSRSFFEEEDMEEISNELLDRPKTTGKSRHVDSRATTPAQKVYDFPVNLHRPRDRMDIIQSVQLRRQMEAKLSRNNDSEEDFMVDKFIESRQNVRYQRQERKETSRDLEDMEEMSHASLSTTAEENEFGLSEAFLHKWSNSSNYDDGSSMGDQSLQMVADVMVLKPPNPHSLIQS